MLLFFKGEYHKFIPEFFLILYSLPSFFRYIYFFILFRDKLVQNANFENKVLDGTYPKAGLKLFVRSKINEVELIRKETITSIVIFSISFPVIFILSLLTIHDDIPEFIKDFLSCFK